MTSERVKITNGGLVAMGKVIRAYEGINDNAIPPGVNNWVQPVTQADRMLEIVRLFELAIDLTGGGSLHIPAMVVPTGKRRTLVFAGRGATTVATTLEISDGDITVPIQSSGMSPDKFNGINIPMEQGWSLGMHETGDPADSGRFVSAIFIETDAFLS